MSAAPLRLVALVGSVALVGCGSTVRRFPMRAPMAVDDDMQPYVAHCHKDAKGRDQCGPEPYESSFAWDGADNLLFRPLSRFLAVEPGGEATNVNALDEVPDSSWFVNRMTEKPPTLKDVRSGFCGDDPVPQPSDPDGAWLIDHGKDNGANPGFRVTIPKVGKFMFKLDDAGEPEKATGATAIATRIYYALGWWAPCDSVVYARRSVFKLQAGLQIHDNAGHTFPFDEAHLSVELRDGSRRGDLYRFDASKWLPGESLGPFTYDGIRKDDVNDVVAHEDRRDLRGARVLAAWLGHFDAREQNSMTTWVSTDAKTPGSNPGYVRHWYLDLGDCFGSQWDSEEITRRLNFAYYLDFPYLAEDWVTLGVIERPWERAKKDNGIFGYFSSRDFDPDGWHPGYPNPAFGRMTEHDAAWATRLIARFTPAMVETAIDVGDYTEKDSRDRLLRTLLERRMMILRRYFSRLSSLAEPHVDGDRLCVRDLAASSETFPVDAFHDTASQRTLAATSSTPISTTPEPDAHVCATLAHVAQDGGVADDDASRYLIVRFTNGVSKGPLDIHLYDLGPKRGFFLAGLERPNP